MRKIEKEWLLREGDPLKAAENLKLLKKGVPVDYLIGFSKFLGLKIDLSFRPLIPRPETEFWVENVIKEIKPGSLCLDIFAGSGCIGLAVLKHVAEARVDFAEIEGKFLKQIRINAKLNDISSKRYRLIQSDVFGAIKRKYDFILANPPYVDRARNEVSKSVFKYEPLKSVFAKDKGLFYIKKLIQESPRYLQKNGVLFFEFDSWQKKEIESLSPKIIFLKDQYGKWRYASFRL